VEATKRIAQSRPEAGCEQAADFGGTDGSAGQPLSPRSMQVLRAQVQLKGRD